MHLKPVSEAAGKGLDWFHDGTGVGERYYVYDVDGLGVAFSTATGQPIDPDGVRSFLYFTEWPEPLELRNAGPPGDLRGPGLWLYRFNRWTGRLHQIISPSGSTLTFAWAQNAWGQLNVEVSAGCGYNQATFLTWTSQNSISVRLGQNYPDREIGIITVIGTGQPEDLYRVAQIAWTGLPPSQVGYSQDSRFFTECSDGLVSTSTSWGSYPPSEYPRLDSVTTGSLTASTVLPSYPAPNQLWVDTQFAGAPATHRQVRYEKYADSGVDRLRISLFGPRLNGSEDDPEIPDMVTILNKHGRVHQATYWRDATNSATCSFGYTWPDNQLASITDYTNQTWTIGYTDLPIYGAGSPSWAYLPSSVTDPTGYQVSWLHKQLDSDPQATGPPCAVTKVILPGGFVSKLNYDSFGKPLTALLPGHTNPWRHEYYSDQVFGMGGYLKTSKDPTGRLVDYTGYDALGNVTSSQVYPWDDLQTQNPEGPPLITTTLRDAVGRVTEVRFSDFEDYLANSIRYAYSPTSGVLQTVTDQVGRQVTYDYTDDGSGLLDKVRLDPEGLNRTLFDFGYDAFGRTATAVGHNGVGVQYVYGDRTDPQLYDAGELSQVRYDRPGSGQDIEEFRYYRHGLVREWVTSNSPLDLVSYEYDNNGRVTGVKINGADYATFSYDQAGRLLTAERRSGPTSKVRETRNYDPTTKRLSSLTSRFYKDGGGYFDRTLTFTYYPDGLRKTLQDNTGTTYQLDYTYDDAGRLIKITEVPLSAGAGLLSGMLGGGIPVVWGVIAQWEYDSAGRLVFQEYNQNRLDTTYAYHDFYDGNFGHGFIEEATTVWQPVGAQRTSFEYTAHPDNRVATFSAYRAGQPWGTGSYSYDSLGQLSSVSGPGAGSYAYDDGFNLAGRGGVTFTYDTNRLMSAGLRTFTYNGLGARATDSQGSREFLYDAFGNLVQVKENGNPIYSCDYDAFGRRFRETVGGVTRYFLYDGGALYAELGSTGTLVRKFYWGLTGPICQRMPSGTNRWYSADAHGNTRALADDNGALTDWYTYDAWGNLVPGHSNVVNDNPFRWNGSVGYRYVAPTGLYNAGAREYDPSVGRWLQRDPIGMAGGHPNLYVYCANNPVEAADPAGLRAATPAPSWAGLWTTDEPGYDMEDVAELVSKITPKPRDWFDNLTDFFAGMGDTISLGGTEIVRDFIGVSDAVNPGSGWYTGGQVAGYAWWAVGGKVLGPAGPIFGRARYRGGTAGLLNRGDKLRIGWSWWQESPLGPRNWFSIHGGVPSTPGHWHWNLLPWVNLPGY